MKLSLIIPTRSRAEYLCHSLATALVARDKAGCNVEIIVSDNQSEDDTADVLQRFAAEGVRCLQTPTRYSMRNNFEYALSAATGTHVLFIGDDDAVLPSGLAQLARIVGQTGAEVVNWTVPNYLWPDPARGAEAFLEIRPAKLSGRLERRAPADQLSKIMAGRFRNYYAGGVIYHGCVAASLIQRARALTEGTYFWTSTPDVFASMRNVMLAQTDLLRLGTPLTLGGASPRSNGGTWQRYSAGDPGAEALEFARFIRESHNDVHNGSLPSDCASVTLLTLDALLLALRQYGRPPAIDQTAWRAKVEQDLRGLPTAVVQRNRRYLDHLMDPEHAAEQLLVDPPLEAPAPAVAPDSVPRPPKSNLTRVPLMGGKSMQTVQTAAETLENICGLAKNKAETHFPVGSLIRAVSVLRRSRAVAASVQRKA